jgi:hypothetical protein
MKHESTRDFFLGGARPRGNDSENVASLPIIPPPLRQELSRLDTLHPEERQRVYANFQQFFALTADEQRIVLETLPAGQRTQVEEIVAGLDRLPKRQRDLGLKSLDQLAALNDEQRLVFFNGLNRWKNLPADEKQTWLKMVAILPPRPLAILPTASVPVAVNQAR